MAKNKNVRVELTTADLARRGVITVIIVLALLALIFSYNSGMFGGPDKIEASLVNAGGSLASNADVKMNGLQVGTVTNVKNGPDGKVRVELSMLNGELKGIPDNVVARILPATVFGTSYVDLTYHGDRSSAALKPGAVVPEDSTQQTLELQKALDDIDALVKVLSPAKLNSTLSAAAMALDGRGDKLGSMFDNLNAFLTKLTPELPLLRSDIGKFAVNMDVLAKASPQILDGLQDSLGVLRTVAAEQGSIATLLTGGRKVVDDSNALLTSVRPDLVPFIQNAATVTQTYSDFRCQAFGQTFAVLQKAFPQLASILQASFAHVDVALEVGGGTHYGPADAPNFNGVPSGKC